MTNEKNEQIAVFRFGVIHELIGGARLTRDEKRRLIRDKCARKWVIPFSARTRISEKTIYRWIRCYRKSGGRIESLYPRKRDDQGKFRKLDQETVEVILNARRQNPDLVVPQLLSRLKLSALIPQTTGLSTIYRVLHQHNLMHHRRPPEDRRKFEARQPNDIWQSDVMHGPKVVVNQRKRKTYLIAFLDDHSRLIVHAGFYLSENLSSFMDAYFKALSKRGLPRKLYVDNGAAYRSHRLEFTCASLAIALIHARAYMPQGKGKIERWFRFIRSSFLPTADLSCLEGLNQSLADWLETYHQRKHSATGMTPFDRYSRNLACIRPAPQNLQDHFRKAVFRKVARDRTVSLDGNLFEAPVALIGKRVQLLYHENDLRKIEVFDQQQSHGFLVPMDPHVNCRVKRDKISELKPSGEDYQGGALWK